MYTMNAGKPVICQMPNAKPMATPIHWRIQYNTSFNSFFDHTLSRCNARRHFSCHSFDESDDDSDGDDDFDDINDWIRCRDDAIRCDAMQADSGGDAAQTRVLMSTACLFVLVLLLVVLMLPR